MNVSMVKNTRIAEHANLQFRAEAFNLLNRAKFDLPENFVGDPAFGSIQSASYSVRIGAGFLTREASAPQALLCFLVRKLQA